MDANIGLILVIGFPLALCLAESLSAEEVEMQRDILKAWLDGEDRTDLPAGMEYFQPVRAIRNRHKCVSLAYDACVTALQTSNKG